MGKGNRCREKRECVKSSNYCGSGCCPTTSHPRVWRSKPFSPWIFFGSHLDRAVVGMTLWLHLERGVVNDWWDPSLDPQPWSGPGNRQRRLSPLRHILVLSLKARRRCITHGLPTATGVNTVKWVNCHLRESCGRVILCGLGMEQTL